MQFQDALKVADVGSDEGDPLGLPARLDQIDRKLEQILALAQGNRLGTHHQPWRNTSRFGGSVVAAAAAATAEVGGGESPCGPSASHGLSIFRHEPVPSVSPIPHGASEGEDARQLPGMCGGSETPRAQVAEDDGHLRPSTAGRVVEFVRSHWKGSTRDLTEVERDSEQHTSVVPMNSSSSDKDRSGSHKRNRMKVVETAGERKTKMEQLVNVWGIEDKIAAARAAAKEASLKALEEEEVPEHQAKMQVQVTKGARKVMHGASFHIAVSAMRCAHALFVGASADRIFFHEAYGDPAVAWFDFIDISFTVYFFFEMVVRMAAERCLFFVGDEWKWNLFDVILVALSVLDFAISQSTNSWEIEQGAMTGMAVTRILRLTRFVRLMRIFRVVKQLGSLRLILLAIFDSMVQLAWCFLFIAFFMYIFAVLVVYGAADFFIANDATLTAVATASSLGTEFSAGGAKTAETAANLKQWWGGIYRSMVTLFMAITGGVDWSECVSPLTDIHVIYEALFTFYIFFMCFGVLNIIIGAFVSTTAQIAESDRDTAVKHERFRLRRYTDKLRRFFEEADVDHSGTLSWEEFSAYLQEPAVKAYFQALELDVSQAHILFDLLDADGSNQVTIEEFLEGCVRLKGGARSVDLNMLLFTCEKVFSRLTDFMADNEAHWTKLQATAAACGDGFSGARRHAAGTVGSVGSVGNGRTTSKSSKS